MPVHKVTKEMHSAHTKSHLFLSMPKNVYNTQNTTKCKKIIKSVDFI